MMQFERILDSAAVGDVNYSTLSVLEDNPLDEIRISSRRLYEAESGLFNWSDRGLILFAAVLKKNSRTLKWALTVWQPCGKGCTGLYSLSAVSAVASHHPRVGSMSSSRPTTLLLGLREDGIVSSLMSDSEITDSCCVC